MMLAEDLLLLAYDDNTGRPIGVEHLEYALAGAMLIELVEHGKLDLVGIDGAALRMRVCDSSPTGVDTNLDAVLAALAGHDGRSTTDVVTGLGRDEPLARTLRERLVRRGVLRGGRGDAAEVLPITQWPAEASTHHHHLRTQLRAALLEQAEPDRRTATLVSLLAAVDAVPRLFGTVDRAAVRKRARSIAEGQPSPDASRRAVEEITAAVLVAALTPSVTGAPGG